MRSSLVVSGLFLMGFGLLLYITELPFGFSWSIPMLLGGLVFAVAGSVMKDSPGPIEAPAGTRFCAYCNTPVQLGERRCSYCNGLQPLTE